MTHDTISKTDLGTLGLLVFGLLVCGSLAYPRNTLAYTIDTTAGSSAIETPCGYASNDTAQCGQTVTTEDAGTISSINLKLRKIGSPSDNLTFSVQLAPGDLPDNTPIASADAIALSSLSSSCGDVTINFSSPVSLDATTRYALVGTRSGSYSTTNNWEFCGSVSDVYAGGRFVYNTSNSTTWAGTTFDVYLVTEVTTSGGGGGGTASSTSPFNKQESLLILCFFTFILTVPWWERVLTVTSKRFEV